MAGLKKRPNERLNVNQLKIPTKAHQNRRIYIGLCMYKHISCLLLLKKLMRRKGKSKCYQGFPLDGIFWFSILQFSPHNEHTIKRIEGGFCLFVFNFLSHPILQSNKTHQSVSATSTYPKHRKSLFFQKGRHHWCLSWSGLCSATMGPRGCIELS